MSELKVYRCNEWHNEYTEFYLKSEADKVIAEKDAEIAELIEKNKRLANKDFIMASETIKDLYDELRHHRYKRSLAMADNCEKEAMVVCYNEPRIEWLGKWKLRWLELAEKFKEAK